MILGAPGHPGPARACPGLPRPPRATLENHRKFKSQPIGMFWSLGMQKAKKGTDMAPNGLMFPKSPSDLAKSPGDLGQGYLIVGNCSGFFAK